MSIFIANATSEIDSSYHSLVKHINSPIPIVMVSWSDNFIFNDELLGLGEYILIDFIEHGWNHNLVESLIWGKNSHKFPRYYTNDWVKFDNWVKDNPPKIQFVRELLKQDVSDTVKPIEYPCIINPYLIDEEHVFNRRPLDFFQYWGRSSEHRVRIHAELLMYAYNNGFQLCDNIYYTSEYIKYELGTRAASLWIPHYARLDVSVLMSFNNLSKLSLSWGGAGFKCFRTSESPVNSVMVMHKNDMAWAYQWDETNCILVEQGKEIEGIEAALNNPNLYEIYKKGLKNIDNYRTENYINNYILPTIQSVL